MNTELFWLILKLFNAMFCFGLVALSFWHNAKYKTHSAAVLFLLLLLFLALVIDTIWSSAYSMPIQSISLVIILLLLLNFNRLKSDRQAPKSAHNLDGLIDQAQQQERSRIYANLHDDVGAKLLQLIYTASDDDSKKMAKQILADIRQAVASTLNVHYNINQLVSEITQEAESRLQTASILLKHNNTINNPKQRIPATVPMVISRICREVISNIIKHAQASEVEISILSTQQDLTLCINDNGKGFKQKNLAGKGLKSINKRAQSIAAVVNWQSQTNKGTQFSLTYPHVHH